ncbi:hypothetical protein C900_05674 [Fulvivirga imtechensis AK7]|uniref:Uncharacterized protein n=1 Tax=Fulvivirga imtechensis AK7 TaxID=1237149 RepID=L8JKV7_9BACT|nr:hypothetical protein C900_05674 [Fulvivirga imtechensis AK7]
MRAKIVDLIGNRILKSFQDQERDDHNSKSYPNTANCYFMYGRRKAVTTLAGNSFGYKIR